MTYQINTRDILIAFGGCVVGFLASKTLINKAKKQLRKEILKSNSAIIKDEIKDEISKSIKVDEIKDEIKDEINKDIVDDILKQNKDDMKEIKNTINDFEDKLDEFENQVLDFDRRVGKLLTGGITAVLNNINKGRE